MNDPFYFQDTINGRVLKTSLPELSGSFSIDYTKGTLGFRLTPKRVLHEPLAKLIDKSAFVFDATGGIAKDAIMMALMGCRVWCCEAHPLVSQLVLDALKRAQNEAHLRDILLDQNRFRFFEEDALVKLLELKDLERDLRPDIVYLDPMFPQKQKSSIAKKDMQWLQQIHAFTPHMFKDYSHSSEEELFDISLAVAKKRVVVKRPLRAPPIVASPQVSFSKSFQSARFDVYNTP